MAGDKEMENAGQEMPIVEEIKKAKAPKKPTGKEEHKTQLKTVVLREGTEQLARTYNPMMSRDETSIIVYHGGKPTPGRQALLESISHFLKVSKDLVVIDKIYSKPGIAASEVTAQVYKKKEDIPKGKIEKMNKAGKPAEAKPEAGEKKKPVEKEKKG